MKKYYSIQKKPKTVEPQSPKIYELRITRNNEKTYLRIDKGFIVLPITRPNIPLQFKIMTDEVIGYKNVFG